MINFITKIIMLLNFVRRYNSHVKNILDISLKSRCGWNHKDEIPPKSSCILLPDAFDENLYSKLKEMNERLPIEEVKAPNLCSEMDKPPLPNIISVQNPYTWLVNRFDMKLLQSVWDPVFKQEDFVKGAKQAIARVTHLASEGKTTELHGLISRQLLAELKEELAFPETGRFWAYLGLDSTNLVVARPRRLLFQMHDEQRFSHIDMMFVAMKWLSPNRKVNGLMYLEIFARFRREYTLHCISDWTIVVLLITKCDVLKRVPRP